MTSSSEAGPGIVPIGSLDPIALGRAVDKLVTAALAAQTWSLVCAAEVAVQATDKNEAQAMRTAQEDVRDSARAYLGTQVPGVVKRLVDIRSAAALFQSMQTLAATAPEQSAVCLDAVTKDFGNFQQMADEFAKVYESFCEQVETRGTTLADRAGAEIRRLSAGKGKIAATTRALKDMQQTVSKDLDDLIEASHKAGKGARKILDSVADSLRGIGGEGKPAGGSTAVHGGIEDASSGDVGKALQNLRKDSEKLEKLYKELAGLQAGLQTAVKVESDCNAYVRSVRAVAGPARAVANMWQQVYAEYATAVVKHTRPGDSAALAKEIDGAAVKWESLLTQTKALSAAITGN
ncbi:hypothetical protein [Streptomyces sp. UNOB3_S3]|uniref:hypothetical protein n=1 Tax=Streptomyces sp. UNOB3_S3 TaxID=2871682 RepID=UPI001E3211A8|nr:hypothetical protein [Streptomyces sp. UNOB3_S3]MCC3774134.1 hypothetical protein [Streptomyces sp. UNOB3_S3]